MNIMAVTENKYKGSGMLKEQVQRLWNANK
jgi:hypothetical protein